MSFTQIQPGQADWLTQLNNMLKGESFNFKHFQCSMMNGATGWGSESIWYNDDVYIAQANSWFNLPAGNNIFIDFMDNPMKSIMDFSNEVLSQAVCLAGNAGADQGYGRIFANAALDNQGTWGVYSTESSSHVNAQASYSGFLHIVWVGSRGDLTI